MSDSDEPKNDHDHLEAQQEAARQRDVISTPADPFTNNDLVTMPREQAIALVMKGLTRGQVYAQFYWALDVMQALMEKGWKEENAAKFIREQLTRLQ